ncbi:Serine threonine- kinase NIM1 [Brachionus plicatilis]|uniref:non-specific serine/threonine protein kinase n=1 Tax=Brachionus plicatilis TaxID=10195 RepID=A0A3M7S208_BRAPC|nr:Serine threonine- kinase NIM1 [Brachionus plicatilis]
MLLATNGFMVDNSPTKYEKLVDNIKNNPEYKREILLNKLVGFYRIGSEIGIGNFSKVKLGLHLLTKEKVAIKILNKIKLDDKTQRLLLREISSMQKLHHPHIIRLYEVIHTHERLFICMEYASEGELYSKVSNDGRINELESRIIFSQIISAVDYLHSSNIIHRDIKAENIFFSSLSPVNVKLGDFGFSIEATIDRQLNTYCGSPPYAAPELFRDDHYVGIYVDLWALGVLLYFMVTGQMPFRADTVGKLKRLILNGDYTIPSFVSDTCQFLIKGILRPIPIDRFSVKEIMHSAWLDSEKFSDSLLSFQFNPCQEQSKLSKEELYSLKILQSLGITKQHLISSNITEYTNPAQRQSSYMSNLISSRALSNITNSEGHINMTYELKQSINGTYRIIFHLVQKKLRKETSSELEANSFFFSQFSSIDDSPNLNRSRRLQKNSCSTDGQDLSSRKSRQESFSVNNNENSIFCKAVFEILLDSLIINTLLILKSFYNHYQLTMLLRINVDLPSLKLYYFLTKN